MTTRFSVGIDMGGTFTDVYVTSADASAATKVPTIRFDLTRSLVTSLRSAAEALGMDYAAFMRQVAVLKVATTVGTNAVIEGTGTRVGLVVARGHERDLYGTGAPQAIFERFLRPDDVAGIGDVGDDVLTACRLLVDNGVRQVVVSLPTSASTHDDESRVRRVVRERYPEHYLRSVPLQLSTDVTACGEDDVRTATAIVNAYLHRDMAQLLSRAEQELRAVGLDVPILVVHANSGVARVATTIALGTYSAGPSAGLSGAELVARRLGDRLVLTADMGGTTLDLGVVIEGQCEMEVRPSIAGVRVALPMNRTESFGVGGGSLIDVVVGDIRVGPESAGSVPGPAAFGRGGRRPTVTDVDMVAGLLADGAVLGGQVSLSGASARSAVDSAAEALGLSTESAAARIEARIHDNMGQAMKTFVASRAIDPASVTLYGFGGAGPLHFARAATVANIRRIRTFPYGSVFSAFGCTAIDVRRHYEVLIPPGGSSPEAAHQIVEKLLRRAGWDLAAEGFLGREGTCHVSLLGRDGRELERSAEVPLGLAAGRQLADATWRAAGDATTLVLAVHVPLSEQASTPIAMMTPSVVPEHGTERQVWWDDQPTRTRVVGIRDIPRGGALSGPVLISDGETTYAVPRDWSVRAEEDGSLLWERVP